MPPPPAPSYGQTVFEEHLNSLQKRRKRFFECLCLAAHHTRLTHKYAHTHTSPISWLCNCHFIQAYSNTWVHVCPTHPPADRIMQEIQLYPAPCLTKRVDWTINASMDLSKAFRKAEGRLSLNSVVTVCDSRPGIKAAITQTCCGSKQYDQSRKRKTHTRVQELNCNEWTHISKWHFNQVCGYFQRYTTVLLFTVVLLKYRFILVSMQSISLWFLIWIIWTTFTPQTLPFVYFTKQAKLLKQSSLFKNLINWFY